MNTRFYKSWNSFWHDLGATALATQTAYRALIKRYGEVHRAYHNLEHIDYCIHVFDRHKKLAQRADVLETAIYYHDVIYDPRRSDNEEKSIEFAADALEKLGMPQLFIDRVSELIAATKHNTVLTDNDEQLIADIDLSGFAEPWTVVCEQSRRIRFEYSWVPKDEYIAGRSKILKGFLDRPQGLYYLPEFREKYDKPARENIAREIDELSQGIVR